MLEKQTGVRPAPRQETKRPARPIDASKHLRQRKAVAELLKRQKKLFVSRTIFGNRGMRAFVYVGDRLYDVSERQLAMLKAGTPPEELSLEEVEDDARDNEY